MIMDVAANYVREHMVEMDRIQGVVTKGGVQPNVVPDFAEMWYFLRSPDVAEGNDLLKRITNCAKGAAIATDTEMKREIVTGTWDKLPNLRLAQLGWDNLDLIGIPEWTSEEVAWAKELQKNMGTPEVGLPTTVGGRPTGVGSKGRYSTDMGDVSWITPSASYRVASGVPGTTGHAWSAVVAYGSSIGYKGMLKVAQLLAISALDLFTHPEILDEVWAEHKERTEGVTFESRLEPDSKPSLDYFKAEMARFDPLMEEYYTSPK
jgi:aminobenzoyl-glutamate utilization protein B